MPAEIPPVPRAQALGLLDERLVQAKHAIARASLSCLRGEPVAALRVRDALAELQAARELLAVVEAEAGEDR